MGYTDTFIRVRANLKDMTKTHKTILLLYLLTVLAGILIPLGFCWDEKLKWSLDIARTISIISASILALFYFDPFGIRKSNLAKQHENVIQILEKTFTQRIIAETVSTNPNSISKMLSQHFMTTRHLKFIFKDERAKDYLNFPVLLNLENFIEKTKELTELKNSIFTPKSISTKMTFLEFYIASRTGNKYESFSIVTWGGGQEKDQDKLCDQINNENLTLKVLFENYQYLINECINWLETNSFSTKQLNVK